MAKKNILIFFGGCSSEYGVSLSSAAAVLMHIDKTKYRPVPVGITEGGDWYYYPGPVDRLLNDSWHQMPCCVPALLSPNRSEHCLILLKSPERDGFRTTVEKIRIDAALPILHGKNGEDGTLQGLIELSGIPLLGCGTLASALCMDKDRAHKLVSLCGIRVPKSVIVSNDLPVLDFVREVGYPLFVKPVRAGSSYGVTQVKEESELVPALRLAREYDISVIIEEAIPGFEVGCAVLDCANSDSETLITGEVDEIELSGGFFDFMEKYTLKTSSIHVPARIRPEKAAEIKDAAKRIYRALDCRGFARVDMFLTPEGEIVFNEVNTIPGFTEHSRYPGMMKAAGLSFSQVLDRILETGVGNT